MYPELKGREGANGTNGETWPHNHQKLARTDISWFSYYYLYRALIHETHLLWPRESARETSYCFGAILIT